VGLQAISKTHGVLHGLWQISRRFPIAARQIHGLQYSETEEVFARSLRVWLIDSD